MSNIAVEITHNGQDEVIAIKLDGTTYSPAALLLMVQRVRQLEAEVKQLRDMFI